MISITRDLVDGRQASEPAQSDLPEAPPLTEFSRRARVDRRVVSLAFGNGAALAETGSLPRLAINLSARSINEEMAGLLINEAKRVGYPLENAIIEVTETAVLRAGKPPMRPFRAA